MSDNLVIPRKKYVSLLMMACKDNLDAIAKKETLNHHYFKGKIKALEEILENDIGKTD